MGGCWGKAFSHHDVRREMNGHVVLRRLSEEALRGFHHVIFQETRAHRVTLCLQDGEHHSPADHNVVDRRQKRLNDA